MIGWDGILQRKGLKPEGHSIAQGRKSHNLRLRHVSEKTVGSTKID